MRLGVSSAAAPGAALEELLEACARRGLEVLELEGDVPADDAAVGIARFHGDTVEFGSLELPVMRGPAAAWVHDVASKTFAWEVNPVASDVAADAALLLVEAGKVPAYVRLVGGGPETQLQEGLGIGTVMGRLALAGYDGPLVVTPSSPRYRVAWQIWLGRRAGTGCGSKVSDPSMVTL